MECRTELREGITIAPEQVVGHVHDPTRAALIDRWGRIHLLDKQATVGRDLEGGGGIAIHAPLVSRTHAKLSYDAGVWTVCDLGSLNGTFVDDKRADLVTVIRGGERVRFGQVAFFFVDHVEEIPSEIVVDSETVRPGAITQQFQFPEIEPWATLEIHEPTGGGGGIAVIDGKRVQLTLAQLELVGELTDRMEAEHEREPELRGFVSVSELLGKLSLEVATPRDAHIRQLIRRVRRSFIKAGLPDLIESRYGQGYRIRLLKARR